MDREKMIEEMAKIANEKHDKEYRMLCTAGGCTECISEALYDAGYRKVPDGAVVLTKEEYERLDKHIKAVNVYEMQMKNGEIDMTVGSDNAKLFISTLVNLFRQNGAKNFFSTTVECVDNGEKYSLTVKKENGKSIAEATNEKVEQARKEMAKRIFERIHEKEGYYPLASVGTSQNDVIEIAKDFGIRYTPDGVEVEE